MSRLKNLSLSISLLACLSAAANQEVKFKKACEDGESITISAVGDILLHETLQRRAVSEQSFSGLWENIIPYFEAVDYSYGNLESPAAKGIDKKGNKVRDPGFVYDGKVYSSYPLFNYYPSVIRDLKRSGLDIVSTANNHSLDRLSIGVDETVKAIYEEELEFIGTRHSDAKKADKLSDWYKVTNIKGIKVAWVACTFIMNYPMTDVNDQVMYCHSEKGKARIDKIIAEQKKKVDAIIITPHWGAEYNSTPNQKQKDAARDWIEKGATAVIGSHPHVLQPMEKITAKDGREGFVIYSLGNFVSNQGGKIGECAGEKTCLDRKIAQRTSIALFLGLTKNSKGTFINGVKALPIRMVGQDRIRDINLEIISKDYEEFDEELAIREDLSSPRTNGEGRRELNHIKNIFSQKNIIYPDQEIVTNSECN